MSEEKNGAQTTQTMCALLKKNEDKRKAIEITRETTQLSTATNAFSSLQTKKTS